MTQPPPVPAPAPGLSADQLRALSEARLRAKKIRGAVTMAKFDFWGTAVFAALTLLGSLLSFSWSGLLIGIAMAIVAYVEFHGARDLSHLDESAPRRLAYNQLFFAFSLFCYAAWSMYKGLHDPGEYNGLVSSQVSPELLGTSTVQSINDLTKLIIIILYSTLALVALTVQPATALFYLSRRKHLRSYLTDTPPWILQAQRDGLPV